MEARGVEPLSEDNAKCASTGVVTDLPISRIKYDEESRSYDEQ